MIPLRILIFGWSGRGKTLAAEEVLRCLSEKGLRVVGVKHTSHPEDLEEPEGTDGRRMIDAGAVGVILTSRGVTRIFLGEGLDLDGAIEMAGLVGAEAVVVEGFKSEARDLEGPIKIVAAGSPEEVKELVRDPSDIFGVYSLSGGGTWEVGGKVVRVYGPGDLEALCSELLRAGRDVIG